MLLEKLMLLCASVMAISEQRSSTCGQFEFIQKAGVETLFRNSSEQKT